MYGGCLFISGIESLCVEAIRTQLMSWWSVEMVAEDCAGDNECFVWTMVVATELYVCSREAECCLINERTLCAAQA
jgi:hypothetical protein